MMTIKHPTVEVCTENLESVHAAAQAGAERVELCSRLDLDGLTPSKEAIQKARMVKGLVLHVLIRPREGNFVYTATEVEHMAKSIDRAKQLGADGVVIGALLPSGDVDMEACKLLIQHAQGMNVTFHRAFDVCRNPMKALEDIISLGAHRILTSGQETSAEDGIGLLGKLVKAANKRIIILPGAGVNDTNARRILRETGATEIHGSFRKNGIVNVEIIKNIVNINLCKD